MAQQQKDSGICKWFNSEKGFGFITPDNGNADLFVHQTSIHAEGFRNLEEGEKVEYDIEINHDNGKSKAVNVTGPGGAYVKGAQRQERQGQGYGNNSRGRDNYGSRDQYGSGRGRQQRNDSYGDDRRGYNNDREQGNFRGQGQAGQGQGRFQRDEQQGY